MPRADHPPLAFHPATPDRWADIEALFGPERGANSGCWCTWWRGPRSAWEALGRDGRKRRCPPGRAGRRGAGHPRLRGRARGRLVRWGGAWASHKLVLCWNFADPTRIVPSWAADGSR